MKKMKMLKIAAGVVVTVGVGAIVGGAIRTLTPTSTGLIKKICVGVGTLVLTGMISEKAADYAEQQIDSAITFVTELVDENRS